MKKRTAKPRAALAKKTYQQRPAAYWRYGLLGGGLGAGLGTSWLVSRTANMPLKTRIQTVRDNILEVALFSTGFGVVAATVLRAGKGFLSPTLVRVGQDNKQAAARKRA